MISFGLAEVITGLTHNFFGIHTTQGTMSAYAAAAVGVLYAISGLLILTMSWRAALSAIALLIAVIADIELSCVNVAEERQRGVSNDLPFPAME